MPLASVINNGPAPSISEFCLDYSCLINNTSSVTKFALSPAIASTTLMSSVHFLWFIDFTEKQFNQPGQGRHRHLCVALVSSCPFRTVVILGQFPLAFDFIAAMKIQGIPAKMVEQTRPVWPLEIIFVTMLRLIKWRRLALWLIQFWKKSFRLERCPRCGKHNFRLLKKCLITYYRFVTTQLC